MLPRTLLPAAVLALVAVSPAAAPAATARPDVTVMSRNLYLGADIIKLATASDQADEMQQAAALHQTVDQTNFPLRAKAFAREIKSQHPDLVGLQEVARYYRGPDGVHDGKTNATTPLYDWMALLQTELKAAGQSYRVAIEQTELDVEVPSAEGYDLRLKLGNAILVRNGSKVKVTRAFRGTFTKQLSVPLSDQTITLKRGFAAVDAKVAGRSFRFIDPHAEAYSDDDATAQLGELLSKYAKSKRLPTILAGDFNSSPTRGKAYNSVIKAGFHETGVRAATCCQDEKLDNPVSKLAIADWIDHIVVRPRATVLSRKRVGYRTSDRVGGLWPSDHAGLVVKLRLR